MVALSPSYMQILEEDPAYPEALIGRGTAYAFQRELDAAMADFTKVLERTLSNRCIMYIEISYIIFLLYVSSLHVVYLRLYNIIHWLVRHGKGEVRPGRPWESLLR